MRFVSLIILAMLYTTCSIAQQSFINEDELALLKAEAKTAKTEALIIYDHNKLIVEEYDGFGHRDSLVQPWSCTKSIVGLAFIALLDDGLLDSLDLPVYEAYPEWNQGLKKDITVKHLLTMTSGLQAEPRAHAEILPSHDCIQLALAADVVETPGTIWRYNNKGFNLLAGIIQKLSGKPMDVYIQERLFEPLNITKVKWGRDPSNNPYAFLGCHLRPLDFAKFGLLLLNKGIYEGTQVLSEENLTKIYQPTEARDNYGLGWWMGYYPENDPDDYTFVKKIRGIAAGGSYGNYLVVVPDKNVVAVILISYKTYGISDEPYDTSVDQYGPTSFGDFILRIYDVLKIM